MTNRECASLADMQLIRLITRNEDRTACEAEWLRRWGRPYPWHRTVRGWEKAEGAAPRDRERREGSSTARWLAAVIVQDTAAPVLGRQVAAKAEH